MHSFILVEIGHRLVDRRHELVTIITVTEIILFEHKSAKDALILISRKELAMHLTMETTIISSHN